MRTLQLIALAFVALAARADPYFNASVNSTYSSLQCCDGSMLWSTDGSIIRMYDNGHGITTTDPVTAGGFYLNTGPLISYVQGQDTTTYIYDGGVFGIIGNGAVGNLDWPLPPGYECVEGLYPGCFITTYMAMRLSGYFTGDVTVVADFNGGGLYPFLASVTGSVIFTIDPTLVPFGGLPGDTFTGYVDGYSGGIQVFGTAVPEPSALLLLATACIGLAGFRRVRS